MAINKDKYTLGAEELLSDFKVDLELQKAVDNKKKQKQSSGDPYLDLSREQFEMMKEDRAERKAAAEQSALTQGLMGGMQSGVQTAFGSQTPEQAIGGALMTGLQTGLATMNPYVGIGSAVLTGILGSRSAKKAEAEKKRAEKEKKLRQYRETLAGYATSKQQAMQALMTALQ